MTIDPFELLGVDADVDITELSNAFKELCLIVHPDKGGTSSDMRVVTCAYEFVKKTVQNRTKATADFETFCRDWEGTFATTGMEMEEIFNHQPFENQSELPVYLGPNGPDVGMSIGMAAGPNGHLGYTSEEIPLTPCMQLIEMDVHNIGMELCDYAQAHAQITVVDVPPLVDTLAAFDQKLHERQKYWDEINGKLYIETFAEKTCQ